MSVKQAHNISYQLCNSMSEYGVTNAIGYLGELLIMKRVISPMYY